MNKLLLVSITSLLILTGCGFTKDVEVKTVAIAPELFSPPDPRPVDLEDVNWVIITPEKLKEQFEKLGDKELTIEDYEKVISNLLEVRNDTVIYAITVRDYENLALNMQEIIRFIKQQKEIVLYYREATKIGIENE